MTAMTHKRSATGTVVTSLLCLALCMAAMLWAFALNGNPLFYFDSMDYILRGTKALAMVLPDAWLRDPLEEAVKTGGAVAGAAAEDADRTVNASRSIVYSMVMAAFFQLHLQWWFPLFHAVAVMSVAWVAARVVLRARGVSRPALPVLVLPFLVAGAGALPFYVGYLMPDIFAPLILLAAALVTLYGPSIKWGEWVVLGLVSTIGVLSHPSHLLLAAAMVPVAAVVGWMVRKPGQRRGALLGSAFLLALAVLAVGERLAFATTVSTVQKQEVVYWPFLTARLIHDGPGLTYLEEKCPDAAIPTCVLYEALQRSDNPRRFTATHIIFETTEELGSFRLLSSEDQKLVADAQVDFARAVALDRPGEVLLAVVKNTLFQLTLDQVDMTIATQTLVEREAKKFPWLEPSNLSESRSWMYLLHQWHEVLNVVSALVLVAIVFWPGRFSRAERGLAAFVLLGVLANAFVCGAVSQPATRYGARVIWLLPMMATFLWVLQGRLGRRETA